MLNTRRLLSEMALHGDTRQSLAKAIGIADSTMSNRLSGKRSFKTNEVEKISQRYHLEIEDIVDIFFAKEFT